MASMARHQTISAGRQVEQHRQHQADGAAANAGQVGEWQAQLPDTAAPPGWVMIRLVTRYTPTSCTEVQTAIANN